MSKPGEHKTVQASILAYAQEVEWTFVSREEAEQRRGFDPEVSPAECASNRSLFFDDLLDAKVREFNPRYSEKGRCPAPAGFRHLHIYGNRNLAAYQCNRPTEPQHRADSNESEGVGLRDHA